MVEHARIGRFVWYGLHTPEKARALSFYTQLFGWQHDPATGHLSNGATTFGKLLPDPSLSHSHWLGHIAVDDVEEAAELARASGGQMIYPPEYVDGLGVVATCADPLGTPFSIIRPDDALVGYDDAHDHDPDSTPIPVGTIWWNVLVTPEPEAALLFNMRLFGWTAEEMDIEGLDHPYYLCQRDGVEVAGIIRPDDLAQPPYWLTCVAVDDVDVATARGVSLGATIHKASRAIDVGRFSVLTTPSGEIIAPTRPQLPSTNPAEASQP